MAAAAPIDFDALAKQAGGDAGIPITPAEAIKAGLHGDAFISTLPDAVASQVKAYAEGRRDFPGGAALRAPTVQSMMNLVAQYDPTFDQTNYTGRSQTVKSFNGSGTDAQAITNMQTAIGHLHDLAEHMRDLNNGRFTPLNAVENKFAGWFGHPNVTNYAVNADRLGSEIVRAYRGTGGAEQDVKNALGTLDPNMSPDQQKGAVKTTAQLLQSKIQALQDKYEKGMGGMTRGFKVLPDTYKGLLDQLATTGEAANLNAQGKPTTTAKPIPDQVKSLLTDPKVQPGVHKLSDGTSWIKGTDGNITPQ